MSKTAHLFYESLEIDTARIRQELLKELRQKPTKIHLPALQEAIGFAMSAMPDILMGLREATMNAYDREWMRGSKPGDTLATMLGRLGPPRIIELTPAQQISQKMLTDLSMFTLSYTLAARGSGETARQQDRQNILKGYKDICAAIIDFTTTPPEQHSPLAAFIGQYLQKPELIDDAAFKKRAAPDRPKRRQASHARRHGRGPSGSGE